MQSFEYTNICNLTVKSQVIHKHKFSYMCQREIAIFRETSKRRNMEYEYIDFTSNRSCGYIGPRLTLMVIQAFHFPSLLVIARWLVATGKVGRANKTGFVLVLGVWKIRSVQGCVTSRFGRRQPSLFLSLSLWLTGVHAMYFC